MQITALQVNLITLKKNCPIKNAVFTQLFSFRTKTNSAANDGKWHHICLVWTCDGGKVTIHNDNSVLSRSGFSSGEMIPGMRYFLGDIRCKNMVFENE